MDPSELNAIAEDLDYLRRSWHAHVSEAELRRGTSVLRRLLIDGGTAKELVHAWRSVGLQGEPTIPTQDLLGHIDRPLREVDWATLGGIELNPAVPQAGSVVIYNTGQAGPNGEPTVNAAIHHTPDTLLPVREFVEAPCSVIRGQTIRRREMIKYVANFLGGVHFGRRRRQADEAMLRRIRAWMKRNTHQGFGKNGPYVEVLAAGQALARSADLALLSRRIRAQATGQP